MAAFDDGTLSDAEWFAKHGKKEEERERETKEGLEEMKQKE